MDSVQVLHLGCVSSVFLACKQARDQDQKIVKAYHKAQLQVRHWLNINREVTHLRQLKELGVQGVVELCGTADDTSNVYLVFEPCFGGDLYKRLANHGLLNEAQLCKQVITPLLKVLRSLHQLGIVHRDIKPENIFFQADGTLRLGDFGLAINAVKERPISRVGTLEYMSPEVLAQPSADVLALRKVKPTQLPSYDCKADIWAVGVLVYEALVGVTPFNDADPTAASLKAQFMSPRPLPAGVSAACADFVSQALTKQAAKRPSAVELLGHPWVQAHMTDRGMLLWMEQASMHRAGSDGPLSRASSISQATPKGGSAAVPIALSQASSRHMPGSSSSSCELSSSAPAAFPVVLSTASSFGVGLPWHVPAGPSAGPPTQGLHPASPTALRKPLPLPMQPQQLPPHPFAAAAAQYSTAGVLLGVLSPPATGNTPAISCSLEERHAGVLLPSATLMPRCGPRPGFSRQLSSPARLRHAELLQDAPTPSGEPPSSPPPSNGGARLSALAMSPVRALLGAGRNLVRSRSGAAAPAADGCAVSSTAPAGSRTPTQPVVGFSMRSPLPSPIRGLLQTVHRRKPSHTSSASSLFAAAQWKPGGTSAAASGGSGSGSGSVSVSPQCSGAGCVSSSCGAPKPGLDCPTLMRACSIGPNIDAGLCNENSSGSTAHGQGEVQTDSRHAVAAVVAVGVHGKQPRACGCGAGGSGEHRSAVGQKQQLALLNRYPSAPDPGPLLALPSACTMAKGMPPPAPVSIDRTGSSGMRGMWLKVQGVCRLVSKQGARDSMMPAEDVHCMVSRSP